MKTIFKVFVIAIAVLMIASALTLGLFEYLRGKTKTACVKQTCFFVELASTQAAQEQGLMFRHSLAQNRGMLFVFDHEADYPFWMKNTLIPLDMIWINAQKQVVFVKENAQPCPVHGICSSIDPKQKAQYVLEINGGLADELQIEPGERVLINGY